MNNDFSFLDSFSEETQDRLKRSILECSLLFHTDNSLVPGIKKDDILSKSIFALIVEADGNPTTNDIANLYKVRFGKPIDTKVLDSVLMSLVRTSFISPNEGGYRPHKRAAETMRDGVAMFEKRMVALQQQLIEKTERMASNPLDADTKAIIGQNIRKSLNFYFQLYALDYFYDDEAHHKIEESDVIEEVKRGLASEVSDSLLEAFSELIERPTAEQKQTLMLCVKLFVGAQFLQIDPMVSQIEMAKLKEKRFILDTDFLLYSITRHCRQSAEYKKLLKTLRKLGCELVIPNEVVDEVLKHALCAESNYHRFKNQLNSVDEDVIDQKANNVFVKDYCMNCLHNSYTKSLHSYLYENYLTDAGQLDFIKELINDELHIKVGLDYDIPVDNDYIYVKEQLTEKIYEKTRNSDKDRWRNDSETRSIAEVDAKLMLNALALNKDIQPSSNQELLYANTYLVTFTTKGIKSAKELMIYRKVVTRPELLISLLSEIGVFDDCHDGMFNLFENPFLAQIMSEHWDVVSALSETGVDLRGHSVTVLSRELGTIVHNYLTKKSDVENLETVAPNRFEAITTVDKFLQFANEIKKKNYRFMPDAETLIDKYKEQKTDIENANTKAAKTQAILEKKSHGYDEYLRKMGRVPGVTHIKNRLGKGKKK